MMRAFTQNLTYNENKYLKKNLPPETFVPELQAISQGTYSKQTKEQYFIQLRK